MSVQLVKQTLVTPYFKFNAIAFIPSIEQDAPQIKSQWALCTHGYTSCKMDNIPWAQRLVNAGVPTVIFDLPGHYLGSFEEVKSMEDFKEHAPECFITAYEFLANCMTDIGKCTDVIFLGHSLGALLCIKALTLKYFENIQRLVIGVGFGIGQHKTAHLFETSFYEKTLNIRKQLVSPAITAEVMFPWIRDEKLDLGVSHQTIHLITGEDDVVVGAGGMEALAFELKQLENEVTTYEPKKLPHHEPGLAASHIFHFLKKKFSW